MFYALNDAMGLLGVIVFVTLIWAFAHTLGWIIDHVKGGGEK